jgi:hypothetical protein
MTGRTGPGLRAVTSAGPAEVAAILTSAQPAASPAPGQP